MAATIRRTNQYLAMIETILARRNNENIWLLYIPNNTRFQFISM